MRAGMKNILEITSALADVLQSYWCDSKRVQCEQQMCLAAVVCWDTSETALNVITRLVHVTSTYSVDILKAKMNC